MDQQQQQHDHGQGQGLQGQRTQHQAQQDPPRRENRTQRPERLFVTAMSNITYTYIPRIFSILFITCGTIILTYTFMNRVLPRKAAWGMVGSFGGVCGLRLLGMICLFLDKNCEEKKAWDKRASRASMAFDLEHGLASPSCPHRCADSMEGAWGWIKECFYQGLCFGFCFPCASKKKKRDLRSQGNQNPGQELDGFFERENEGFRRNGPGREGERADDREAGNVRIRPAGHNYPPVPQQAAQSHIRRGGTTQHPRPRPPDLGSPRHHSELPNDDGSLPHPDPKHDAHRTRSNQRSFHGSGANPHGRLDDPRHLYHYTIRLPEPPPFSVDHLKGVEAQTWWVILAFAPDKGAITEYPKSPTAADDHELEEVRHEIPPEQIQAIQRESRLSEYDSIQSSPALNTRTPEQARNLASDHDGSRKPNIYSKSADLRDFPFQRPQEQRRGPSLRRTRTFRHRGGTKHRSDRHQRHDLEHTIKGKVKRSAQNGCDRMPPRVHLNLHGHEKIEFFPATELAGSNDQNSIPEKRMDSPTLGASLGTSSARCEEQYEKDGDDHAREMPPSEHSYPPFI